MDIFSFHVLGPVCSSVWVFTFASLIKTQVLAFFKASCVHSFNWMVKFSVEYNSFLIGSPSFALFSRSSEIALTT